MTTPKKNFKTGTYSIHPSFLRRRRAALNLDITTLNVVESLFNHAGSDLRPWPSIATLATECGKSESTVSWHIAYLRAYDLLPTEHERLSGGRLRSYYDLRPLVAWNASIHDADKAGEPLPQKLRIPFGEWREQQRQRQKGGKRGRRTNTPAVWTGADTVATPATSRPPEAPERPDNDARQRVILAVQQMFTPYPLQKVYEALLQHEWRTRDIPPDVLKRLVEHGLSPDIPVRSHNGISYVVSLDEYGMNERAFEAKLKMYE